MKTLAQRLLLSGLSLMALTPSSPVLAAFQRSTQITWVRVAETERANRNVVGAVWGEAAGYVVLGTNPASDPPGEPFSLTSRDGATWVAHEGGWLSGVPSPTNRLAYGPRVGGRYVALSAAPPFFLYQSIDGASWTPALVPAGTPPLRDVMFDGARFLAVGDAGTVIQSTDGIAWDTLPGLAGPDPSANLVAIANAPTNTTANYVIAASDGRAWSYADYVAMLTGSPPTPSTIYTAPPGLSVLRLVANGTRYYAASALPDGACAIDYSDNGHVWDRDQQPVSPAETPAIFAFAQDSDGMIVAASTDGATYEYIDHWDPRQVPAEPTQEDFSSVTYGEQGFLVAGGTLLYLGQTLTKTVDVTVHLYAIEGSGQQPAPADARWYLESDPQRVFPSGTTVPMPIGILARIVVVDVPGYFTPDPVEIVPQPGQTAIEMVYVRSAALTIGFRYEDHLGNGLPQPAVAAQWLLRPDPDFVSSWRDGGQTVTRLTPNEPYIVEFSFVEAFNAPGNLDIRDLAPGESRTVEVAYRKPVPNNGLIDVVLANNADGLGSWNLLNATDESLVAGPNQGTSSYAAPPGEYLVRFLAVPGYQTPADYGPFTLAVGDTVTISTTYVRTGNVRAFLLDDPKLCGSNAMAQTSCTESLRWRANGQGPYRHAELVGLPPGTYSFSVDDAPTYVEPTGYRVYQAAAADATCPVGTTRDPSPPGRLPCVQTRLFIQNFTVPEGGPASEDPDLEIAAVFTHYGAVCVDDIRPTDDEIQYGARWHLDDNDTEEDPWETTEGLIVRDPANNAAQSCLHNKVEVPPGTTYTVTFEDIGTAMDFIAPVEYHVYTGNQSGGAGQLYGAGTHFPVLPGQITHIQGAEYSGYALVQLTIKPNVARKALWFYQRQNRADGSWPAQWLPSKTGLASGTTLKLPPGNYRFRVTRPGKTIPDAWVVELATGGTALPSRSLAPDASGYSTPIPLLEDQLLRITADYDATPTTDTSGGGSGCFIETLWR